MDERSDRLRMARKAAGLDGPGEAAQRFGWTLNTYKSNENGNAPFSFKKAKEYAAAFGVRPEWLYDGAGEMREANDERLVAIIGHVGGPEAATLYAASDQNDFVPMPPGGTAKTAALLVQGGALPEVAEGGSIIYFEDQREPPADDMIGRVAIVETEAGEVMVKRLMRGKRSGHFDLESLVGEPRKDVRLRWAARILMVVAAHHASKIIRRAGSKAA